MTQLIEFTVIIQHILIILCGNRDLIGYSPCNNTWMIVILYDQLFHLANGIFPSVWHMF